MPSTKEIKNRIESVRETRKITNAMYLIASAKLRKARGDLERTRAYFQALRSEIHSVFGTVSQEIDSRYFYREGAGESRACGCLVIAADKGMAGAYTQNVIKETKKLLSEHPGARLFVVGEYGRHFFDRHQIPIEQDFLLSAQSPSMGMARSVTARLLEAYDEGGLDEIYVIYTDQGSALSSVVRTTRLLPFAREELAPRREGEKPSGSFTFVPSLDAVLEGIIPGYLSGFIYSALVSSYCCEQTERMNAMNTANQNAEKLLEELSLEYNRVRQAAITREITEVSAGAAAQRKANESLR